MAYTEHTHDLCELTLGRFSYSSAR